MTSESVMEITCAEDELQVRVFQSTFSQHRQGMRPRGV